MKMCCQTPKAARCRVRCGRAVSGNHSWRRARLPSITSRRMALRFSRSRTSSLTLVGNEHAALLTFSKTRRSSISVCWATTYHELRTWMCSRNSSTSSTSVSVMWPRPCVRCVRRSAFLARPNRLRASQRRLRASTSRRSRQASAARMPCTC